MYISKISLRKDASSLQKLNQFIAKDGYYYHQLIWQLFSENNPDKKRDFIYRAELDQNWPTFYTVSTSQPVDNGAIWEIASKTYQPKIKQGDKLFFTLRANPRIAQKDEHAVQKRFDVVQNAFIKQKSELSNGKNKADLIQEVGEKWLRERSEKNGFIIKNIIADNFQKHRFRKRKQEAPILFSSLDFRGSLEVIDTEKFFPILFRGIGAAKSFGCGMLMVKR